MSEFKVLEKALKMGIWSMIQMAPYLDLYAWHLKHCELKEVYKLNLQVCINLQLRITNIFVSACSSIYSFILLMKTVISSTYGVAAITQSQPDADMQQINPN